MKPDRTAMELKTFSEYILPVIREGNRLQKVDDKGKTITTRAFTTGQMLAIFLAMISLWLLPNGVSIDFAGYIIGFLGIFVGLFTTLVISMEEKSKTLYDDWDTKKDNQKVRDRLMRNYIVRFTGLTSYSILLGLVVIALLSLVLLFPQFSEHINRVSTVHGLGNFYYRLSIAFVKMLLLGFHRAFTMYFLLNLFIITVFSTTSYFTHLSRQYRNLKIPDA